MNNLLGNLGYGGIVAAIGIFIVFLGLIIIICMIYLISFLLRKLSGEGKKKEEAPAPAPAPALVVEVPAPVQEAPSVVEENLCDDTELIAVITAAIAAMDGGSKPFVIRSVRRVAGWKNAARAEQVYKY